MKFRTIDTVTLILLAIIACLALLAYTVVGSSNITLSTSGGTAKVDPAFAAIKQSAKQSQHSQQRSSYGTEVVLLADSRGHYLIDAEVDRTSIRFLIDTGASQTVLSYVDAQRLGVDVDRIHYDAPVVTGAGVANFASTTLPYVESGHLRVDRLSALVAPEDALPQSVLGVNFLRRLRSYSVESGKMTLVP